MLTIRILRKEFFDDTTIGETYVDGKRLGYCLEDAVREVQGRPVSEWKTKGATAIPTGTYQVSLTMSNRFKRIMPQVHDVPGFEGVRIHGGNSHEDTEGCPLFASRRIGERKIAGSQEGVITEWIRKTGGHATLIVEGLP